MLHLGHGDLMQLQHNLRFLGPKTKSKVLGLCYVLYLSLFSSFDKTLTKIQELMSNFDTFLFETDTGLFKLKKKNIPSQRISKSFGSETAGIIF